MRIEESYLSERES